DVAKDRSRLEIQEFLAHCIFLHHIRTRDVGGHQIRRELNSRELQMHYIGKRGHEFRLSQSRDAFQQYVSAGEQTHDDAIDNLAVTDDDFADVLFYAFEPFLERCNLLIDGSAHLNMNAPTCRSED